LAVTLGACSPQRVYESARLLADLAEPAPTRAAEADRANIDYRISGRDHQGDLYRPAAGARAALVLVPGVTPQGRDDPRLVAFAQALARARFTVLVPEIANLRALRVSPDDATAIADALRHLSDSEAGPVGLAAVSYAAGPAVIAALAPDLAGRIGFLALIGGYYDMTAVVAFFTTGQYRPGPGQPWQQGRPNRYGKWAFVEANAERLEDRRDQVLLQAMAQRKRADLEADVSDLAGRLGPEGRAVLALLENRDPARVSSLIEGLPRPIVDDLRALDLAGRDLSALPAPAILIHGRDDPVIPFTESRALAAALGAERAELYLVDNLAHVDLGPAGLGDALTLWRAAYDLLTARDALRENAAR